MIRIGVLADPHGNLPALRAALAFLREAGCEEFICTGDLVGIGPWPEEVAVCLRALPALTCVGGNHDRYFDRCLAPPYPPRMEPGEAAHHRWVHDALSPASRRWLRGLPPVRTLVRAGVHLCALHYPRDAAGEWAAPVPNPSPAQCEALFAGLPGQVFLCGHDHNGFAVQSGGRLYLNPGSLGCPHGRGGLARCGVLTLDAGTWQWIPAAPRYDLGAATAAFTARRVPEGPALLHTFYGVSPQPNPL